MATRLSRRLVGRTARVATGWGLSSVVVVSQAFAAPPPVPPPQPSAPARPAAHVAHAMDMAARRAIAGGPTADDVALGAESPELRAIREAEKELFPPASPAPGSSWPAGLPLVVRDAPAPQVIATGVPPVGRWAEPEAASPAPAWLALAHLQMPDLPVRWDERVIRYLQFFRDDPRGRSTFANLYRHSSRWRDTMRRTLRRKSLPDDLVWVSMIESGFEPTARSSAGAAGLWQFMPETAKIYGLTLDRWLDQRLDPEAATEAAAELLGDLHRRFGGWELALAGFNMGYAGLASVLRRYNTNDFWSLARTEGTLPWETTLYVPKIIATAIVAHNLAAFGLEDVALDAVEDPDKVMVPPGTPLALVAQAAGCTLKEVQGDNPELRALRTPPVEDGDAYAVGVPHGRGAQAAQGLARLRRDQPPLDRYVVRFGETLEQIAAIHRTTIPKLVELNAIGPGEAVRGGTVLLVPHVEPRPDAAVAGARTAQAAGAKPSVVVPADEFVYPDRQRVFYRVLVGDTLKDIASALHVATDDLRRWNDLDVGARLQEGMTLQVFVAKDADLSRVVVVPEADVRVLPVGSDEFFAALERDKGFKRVTVLAKAGDTLESIGRRFDVRPRTMERINRRGREQALHPGDPVVVYVPSNVSAPTTAAVTASNAPTPNGPLPLPPLPDLLP
jgi:membrane-bound lytic murein transglycosylase D